MNETYVFTFDVSFTDTRPITVDQFTSRVTVAAETQAEAETWAALMVMRPATPALGLREVQMPTRTTLVRVEV
jgi:hypothetical protein